MKFKCGKTQEELKIEYEKRQEKLKANYVWKPWFAWRPVKVGDGDCRWLEIVERRPWYTLYHSESGTRYEDWGYGYQYRKNKG